MRAILFRAWDKHEKKMIDSEYLNYITPEGIGHIVRQGTNTWLAGWFCPNREWMELMQYTGLKDKNGKEIYEGDIIIVRKAWEPEPFAVEYGVQEFADGNYGASSLGWNVPMSYGQKITTKCPCEILGNIYENPELLKEKL